MKIIFDSETRSAPRLALEVVVEVLRSQGALADGVLELGVGKISASSPALPALLVQDSQEAIFSASSIARFLALSKGSTSLYPDPQTHSKQCADVDAWMAFASKTLAGIVSSVSSPATAAKERAQALKDLLALLGSSVESRLTLETYIIPRSKQITLADIFLAAYLSPVFTEIVTSPSFPNLSRYLSTVLNHQSFQAILKHAFSVEEAREAAKSKAAAPASASASAAPSSSTGSSTVGGPRHRNRIANILVTPDEKLPLTSIKVSGWCRTVRVAKGPVFVELSDGSTPENLQVVLHPSFTAPEFLELVREQGTIGASFSFVGDLIKSPAKGQRVEFQAKTAILLGGVPDPLSYPLPKTATAMSLEHLREIAHLRPRTNLISAVTRIRSVCAFAVHQFFNERGFNYIHTPIITASDCEGAGEMFQVTTLMEHEEKLFEPKENADKQLVPPKSVDYSKDFFGKPAYLTVSGQLNVECFACSLSDVYTFGPTFRAENSNTHRHLAEFWMIEPEIAFATLEDDMNLAEDFLKFCIQSVLDKCDEDLQMLEKREESDPNLREKLRRVIRDPFVRLTYTKGVEILVEHLAAGKVQFENGVAWGDDLATEHERYLTEKVHNGTPVILTHYPAKIKAFYMRQSREDPRCVEAMDILCPGVGEIIGGSAREEDLTRLETRIVEMGLKLEDFAWYRDLRRYGSVPHAGFGLGFERLVLFVTGIHNIRDVIPFPRFPQHCSF